jgi:hypothetical protein
MNLCTACGQDFGSLSAFDRHRTGNYAYAYSEEHPDGRRCRNEDEMRAAGLHQDSRGRWRLQARGTPPWTRDVDVRASSEPRGALGPQPSLHDDPGRHINPDIQKRRPRYVRRSKQAQIEPSLMRT